jgi:hypothetical protein
MSIDRDPWWGLLVRGAIEEGKREVARRGITHDDHVLVPGDGWYGFYSFRYEDIDWDLADALRKAGREVIAFHYDRDGQGFAHRWRDGEWNVQAEGLLALAHEKGVVSPKAVVEKRAKREAALVTGRSLDEVREDADGGEVIATSRGVIVFGRSAGALDYTDHPGVTCIQVSRYLDNGDFRCYVQRGDDVEMYAVPRGPESGLPRLDNIEGETDPRSIVRKLGIPEQFMFP